MTNSNPNVQYKGVGFGSLLTLLFIALKLTNVIAWSWLWVLAPTWIPIAILLSILLIGVIFVGIATLAKS